ncbi:MAG: hypothetical protein WAU21_06920 [Chitinophagales bacterium]|nr:hypothetical protein [Chitinophagales bacterium]
MKTTLHFNKNANLRFYFILNLLLSLLIFIPKSSFGIVENTVASSVVQIDSTEEDTVVYTTGDTVAIYTSGLDSVYITYAEAIPDSIMENLWVINDPHKQMIVELSHQHAPVNEGVIGINLTDFFEPLKANLDANVNYTKVPDPWQAVADLAPKTLRIFSGASAKFMHPTKPFYDPVNDITYGGYGYDWTEIISYFDATNTIEAPTLVPSGEYDFEMIYDELRGVFPDYKACDDPTSECLWVNVDAKKRMIEFYEKSVNQPIFDPTDTDFDELDEQPMYINQFISLVNFIEAENPGHVVDVIYCVNIESMSASEMLAVINYLLYNDINLVGVELGNESYNNLGQLTMGFTDFDHYWKYINGVDYTDTDEQEALDFALADDVEEDHDFQVSFRFQVSGFKLKNSSLITDYSSLIFHLLFTKNTHH